MHLTAVEFFVWTWSACVIGIGSRNLWTTMRAKVLFEDLNLIYAASVG